MPAFFISVRLGCGGGKQQGLRFVIVATVSSEFKGQILAIVEYPQPANGMIYYINAYV